MKFLKFLLMAIFAFAFTAVFAGTDTTTVAGGLSLPSNWKLYAAIILAVYEVLARYIPTLKNYSIISLIIGIINTVFPNNKAGDSTTSKFPH